MKLFVVRKNQNISAFTLLEVIVVLAIVSLSLLGTLSLIIQNIQVQGLNRKSLVAYQLAQEGLELIRNTRDANWGGRG